MPVFTRTSVVRMVASQVLKDLRREALLMPALATGNLTLMSNTYVKSLHTSKKEVVDYAVVVDTITGKEKRIYAKLFVVAAQAHESARLLLNSANTLHPNGLGNSSGELGKNLIFSAGGSGQGELREDSLKEIKIFRVDCRQGFLSIVRS